MIYIDTSSLLKLVITDDFSAAVEAFVANEDKVIVSTLTELEAHVQVRAESRSGKAKARKMRTSLRDLAEILDSFPFVTRQLSGAIIPKAIVQHKKSSVHCRSLDRLHLAAMAELGVSRLMTHDVRQADGARELGYKVVMPGVAGWER
jgi:predicted nucleic acid-binding protein